MRVVAKKAQGARKIVARRPAAGMTAEAFAKAFGARAIGSLGDDSNPFSLSQLRAELERRLRSTGGRPALVEANEKWKVAVLAEDAPRLKWLADHAEFDRYKASPAQIATVLVHMALDRFSPEEIDAAVRAAATAGDEAHRT
jgi:hypothetical protein